MNLLDLGGELEQLNSVDDIWAQALDAFSQIGIEFVIYLTVDGARDHSHLLTNIPSIYDNTTPEEDPFLDYCCAAYDPTYTGPEFLPDYGYLPEKVRNFILRASKSGFISGLGLPMRLEGSDRFWGV